MPSVSMIEMTKFVLKLQFNPTIAQALLSGDYIEIVVVTSSVVNFDEKYKGSVFAFCRAWSEFIGLKGLGTTSFTRLWESAKQSKNTGKPMSYTPRKQIVQWSTAGKPEHQKVLSILKLVHRLSGQFHGIECDDSSSSHESDESANSDSEIEILEPSSATSSSFQILRNVQNLICGGKVMRADGDDHCFMNSVWLLVGELNNTNDLFVDARKHKKVQIPNEMFTAVTNHAKKSLLALPKDEFLEACRQLNRRSPGTYDIPVTEGYDMMVQYASKLYDDWWGLRMPVPFDEFEIHACTASLGLSIVVVRSGRNVSEAAHAGCTLGCYCLNYEAVQLFRPAGIAVSDVWLKDSTIFLLCDQSNHFDAIIDTDFDVFSKFLIVSSAVRLAISSRHALIETAQKLQADQNLEVDIPTLQQEAADSREKMLVCLEENGYQDRCIGHYRDMTEPPELDATSVGGHPRKGKRSSSEGALDLETSAKKAKLVEVAAISPSTSGTVLRFEILIKQPD